MNETLGNYMGDIDFEKLREQKTLSESEKSDLQQGSVPLAWFYNNYANYDRANRHPARYISDIIISALAAHNPEIVVDIR